MALTGYNTMLSKKQVVPDLSISPILNRAAAYPSSAVKLPWRTQILSHNHDTSSRSSAAPLRSVCAVCIWVEINPGMIIRPERSHSSSAVYFSFRISVLPISTMTSPTTRIAPSVIIRREASTVTIVAWVYSMANRLMGVPSRIAKFNGI